MQLQQSEKNVLALRSLYAQYGYSHYQMSKFEEYDLYAHHKDFLISDGVLTFTDTNGKLMALKPDVTLSIIKNTKDAPGVRKLYYHENVYRVAKGTGSFRELMQIGLEAMGQVDDYTVFEVLKLAAESLGSLQRSCVLAVSHLGILSTLLDYFGLSEAGKSEALRLLGEKNRHELQSLCAAEGIAPEESAVLTQLMGLSGSPAQVLPELRALLQGRVAQEVFDSFAGIVTALAQEPSVRDMLRIDFSAVDDLHYYNGFVCKGFVEGIPNSVLSGGQYDALMAEMGRKSRAVGFAVYLDLLERLDQSRADFDADVALIYDEATPLAQIAELANALRQQGETVLVQKVLPTGMRFRRIINCNDGGESR